MNCIAILRELIFFTILICIKMCDFIVATVAVVKSRDMHWGLLAQRDHKDINLASLRLLLVADGANPCKFIQCLL